MVPYVIGDDILMPIYRNNSVEIMEYIEPREVESGAPEWVRDPGVQIIIIWWWRIIGYYRRAFGIVVIINH
jgi:hypothetical protein